MGSSLLSSSVSFGVIINSLRCRFLPCENKANVTYSTWASQAAQWSRICLPRQAWWWFSCEVVSNSCDCMNCSPPGSSVHGILQARILEWVAISLSRGSSWPRDRTQVSHIAGRFFTNWAMREAQKGMLWLHGPGMQETLSSIPGSGRSAGEGNGHPLQYSCLKNPMDRGVWRAIVHGVARVGHDLTTKSDLVTKQQH